MPNEYNCIMNSLMTIINIDSHICIMTGENDDLGVYKLKPKNLLAAFLTLTSDCIIL